MSETEKAQLMKQIDQVSGPIIEKYRNASADELKQALQAAESTTELDVLRTLYTLKTDNSS